MNSPFLYPLAFNVALGRKITLAQYKGLRGTFALFHLIAGIVNFRKRMPVVFLPRVLSLALTGVDCCIIYGGRPAGNGKHADEINTKTFLPGAPMIVRNDLYGRFCMIMLLLTAGRYDLLFSMRFYICREMEYWTGQMMQLMYLKNSLSANPAPKILPEDLAALPVHFYADG